MAWMSVNAFKRKARFGRPPAEGRPLGPLHDGRPVEKPLSDPYGAVRMAATQHCRKDPLPIGTVVIRQRNKGHRRRLARYIKVRMDGPKTGRWILYSRWWWEKNRGPVPPGQLVIHKDGDEMNDSPDNLILGTPGTKIVLAHRRDPEMSQRNHKNAAAGTAEYNRLAGKLHRLREILPLYWYPVVNSVRVILNVPFRRCKGVLEAFGANVGRYPANGRARKVVERATAAIGVRPVRGADLSREEYADHLRVDPEFQVGAGHVRLSESQEERVKLLRTSQIWRLAEEAAKKDLRERK